MAEHLHIPQRRRNYSSPEPREEQKPKSINRKNEFLWERIRCHPFSSKLTEIFNTVIESGADLSGPESSDDFRFWFRAVRLIKMNATLEINLNGKKNDYCLDKVLDHAMEVFSKEESQPNDMVEQRRCFSDEFMQKQYAEKMLGELRQNSEAYGDGTRYFAPYTAIVQASIMGKSRCVKQMATYVYTVHICLRTGKESGYPEARFLNFFEQLENDGPEKRVLGLTCLIWAMVKVLISKDEPKFYPGQLLGFPGKKVHLRGRSCLEMQ
jgi:hypothetical protein